MNNKTIKQLRKLTHIDMSPKLEERANRNNIMFSVAKKKYSELPHNKKRAFLGELAAFRTQYENDQSRKLAGA